MKRTFLITLTFLLHLHLNAQETIHLNNPSFEGVVIRNKLPSSWKNAGQYEFPKETPPDHHPNNLFFVKEQAKDGKSYVGLVTRDTRTWESIGQMLSEVLVKGKTYEFSLYLRLPQNYISISRRTRQEANFNQPVILRIWGGRNAFNKTELLAQSPIIDHKEWREYIFRFTPQKDNWKAISFEAYYKEDLISPYNGSTLIDHCSPIRLLNNGLKSMVNSLDSINTDSLTKTKAILHYILQTKQDEFKHPLILNLKALQELQLKLSQGGVRNYIFNHTTAKVLSSIELLEMFELQELANIVAQVNLIYRTDYSTLTKAQKDYFINCESYFNTYYDTLLIEQKILNYIHKKSKRDFRKR